MLRIGGGHRTELKHNCEAEVELYTESLQELGEKLNGATGNTEVNYTIFSTGEEVPNDVEQGR